MLRITRIVESDSAQTLKLEGKLLGPWVDEVRNACAAALPGSSRIRLDLAAVTFVDTAGAELLRDLIRQGVEIAACSSFLASLLHAEGL